MLKKHSKLIALIILIGFLALVVLILKPFIVSIILAIIISYLFYPVYKFFLKKSKRKNLSAFITSVLVILIITIPFLFMVNAVSKEVLTISKEFKKRTTSGEIFTVDCEEHAESIPCRINAYLQTYSEESTIDHYLATAMKRFASDVASETSQLIFKIPKVIIGIFVMLFTAFYLFRDGERIIKKTKTIMPMEKKNVDYMFSHSKDVINGVMYGQLVTAVIQGLIAGFGYFIFGVHSPIFWGIMTAVTALIPLIGTAIIWLPIGLFMIIDGYAIFDKTAILAGVGIILYGALIVSTIDNIIKPKLIGEKARIHPLLVLLGVLGGLNVFGALGIILGPLILALFIALIDIYKAEGLIH